jgi:hypothetical protein
VIVGATASANPHYGVKIQGGMEQGINVMESGALETHAAVCLG